MDDKRWHHLISNTPINLGMSGTNKLEIDDNDYPVLKLDIL
jgi:hypothetical protein